MNKLSQLVEVGIGGLNKPKEHDKDKYIRQYEIEEEMKQGRIIRFRETLHNQKGKDRQGKPNGKSTGAVDRNRESQTVYGLHLLPTYFIYNYKSVI